MRKVNFHPLALFLVTTLVGFALSSCASSGGTSASEYSGSFITVSKKAGISANGISSTIIEITLAREGGEPVSGKELTISATGEGNDITQPVQPTDANGLASATLRSDEPGIKTISVSLVDEEEPIDLGLSTTVHFGPRFGSVQVSAGGGDLRGLALGDLDLDGQVDVATASNASDNVSTLFGKLLGTQAFTFARLDTAAVGTDPSDIAMGDIDGDGDLDLLVTNSTEGTVSILTNNGFGLFEDLDDETDAYPIVTTGANPVGIVSADFNGDGFADFATVNNNADEGMQVTIALADGLGSFGEPVHKGAGATPVAIAMGDFNLDGSMDLVVVNNADNNIRIFINDGSGSFSGGGSFDVAFGPTSVAVGDINDDGFVDLVTINSDDPDVADAADELWLSRLLNDGEGGFGTAVTIPGPTAAPAGIHLADIDGNSTLDILFTQGNNLNILTGDGTGVFSQSPNPTTEVFNVGDGPSKILSADFNNDSFLDVVVRRNGSIGYFTLPRDTE